MTPVELVTNHKSTFPCGHCMVKFPVKGDEKAELRTLGHLDDEYENFTRELEMEGKKRMQRNTKVSSTKGLSMVQGRRKSSSAFPRLFSITS